MKVTGPSIFSMCATNTMNRTILFENGCGLLTTDQLEERPLQAATYTRWVSLTCSRAAGLQLCTTNLAFDQER